MLLQCGFVIFILFLLNFIRRIPWVSGLHKKCVVITGCDSGFGNALAKSLYGKGVYVFAGCFTEQGARSLQQQTGERLRTFMLDVSKPESIKKAYQLIYNNLPPGTELWGLVNNAGIAGMSGPLEFTTRADMEEVMGVNCFGMVDMARTFLPLLKRSKGRIVNVASVAGEVPLGFVSPYTISKFALKGFSESLRREKAEWGIKVATICPAFFRTNIMNLQYFQTRIYKRWESLSQDVRDDYGIEYVEKSIETMKELFETSCANLTVVIEDMEHALFARCPCTAYYPGPQAKVLVGLNNYLPTWIVDRVVSVGLANAKPRALK